jgi:hypothetical protein
LGHRQYPATDSPSEQIYYGGPSIFPSASALSTSNTIVLIPFLPFTPKDLFSLGAEGQSTFGSLGTAHERALEHRRMFQIVDDARRRKGAQRPTDRDSH